MSNELKKLYNTLLGVETKGESTKIMGMCLQFLENLIVKIQSDENEANQAKNIKKEGGDVNEDE